MRRRQKRAPQIAAQGRPAQGITRAAMAAEMETSRAQLNRALGRALKVELV